MKSKKIYIILFIVLYLFVAIVSGIHGFAFFGLANVPLLAIMLAIAFEVGQAAVLFSILTDGSQRKKVMPWLLMGIFTLVQIMGNVYNSYKYLITNAEENLRFFKEPIFTWTQLPDAQANVILAYIQGAILPICALLLTSMVASFLTKKDESEEVEYVEEEEEPEEPIHPLWDKNPRYEGDEPKKEENSNITIDKENGIIDLNNNHTPSHKEYQFPIKEEVEEPDNNEEDKANDEYVETIEEELPKNDKGEVIGTDMGDDGSLKGKQGEDGSKLIEKEIKFPHEVVDDKTTKHSHFLNL